MERPTLSNTDTSLQAGEAAEIYLNRAIEIIKLRFPDTTTIVGSGDVIAALIAAQAADYNACAITDALHELASRIGEAGKDVRKGCEAIAKTIKEGGE